MSETEKLLTDASSRIRVLEEIIESTSGHQGDYTLADRIDAHLAKRDAITDVKFPRNVTCQIPVDVHKDGSVTMPPAKYDVVEVTVLGYDPFDEREGVRFSSKDWKKLAQLPKGTVLRAVKEEK